MSGELLQAGKGLPDAWQAVVLILGDKTVLIVQPERGLHKYPQSSTILRRELSGTFWLFARLHSMKRGKHLHANGEEELVVGLGALPQEEGSTFRSALFQLVDCKLRPDDHNIEGDVLLKHSFQ